MKTFVAENVLSDYTNGMLVVKAKTLEDAKQLIEDNDDIEDWYKKEINENLKELEDNKILFVKGGG